MLLCDLIVRGSKKAPVATKKNSQRVVRVGRFTKVLPSAAFVRFQKNCAIEGWDGVTMTEKVELVVRIYPPRDAGDLDGFLASLFDVLQHYEVFENDRQVKRIVEAEICEPDRTGGRFEVEVWEYRKKSQR